MSTARERLDEALIQMADCGERPVCAWPDRAHLWTSDEHDERARAARRCAGCPVLRLCHDAAVEQDERHHVWGGRDFTRARTERRKKTA